MIFSKEKENCRLSTVVIRGSTKGMMEDIERAIDDAVAVYRATIKSDSFVGGAGAAETAISMRLEQEAKTVKGLDQYSYARYGKAF